MTVGGDPANIPEIDPWLLDICLHRFVVVVAAYLHGTYLANRTSLAVLAENSDFNSRQNVADKARIEQHFARRDAGNRPRLRGAIGAVNVLAKIDHGCLEQRPTRNAATDPYGAKAAQMSARLTCGAC